LDEMGEATRQRGMGDCVSLSPELVPNWFETGFELVPNCSDNLATIVPKHPLLLNIS